MKKSTVEQVLKEFSKDLPIITNYPEGSCSIVGVGFSLFIGIEVTKRFNELMKEEVDKFIIKHSGGVVPNSYKN